MFLLAIPLAIEAGLGLGVGTNLGRASQPGAMLRGAVEISPVEHFGLGLTVLDVPGSSPSMESCGSPCSGYGSFSAISGLLTARWYAGQQWRWYLEGGAGVGHLVSLANDDLFEHPALHGSGGFAWLLGFGVRRHVGDHAAIGMAAQMTQWTNVTQPAHTYGLVTFPDQHGLSVTGAFFSLTGAFAL